MSNNKPKAKYFPSVNFELTPSIDAKLAMKGFHYKNAADTVEHPGKGTKLKGVSAQLLKACEGMTIHTELDAVKELVVICDHYDSKGSINWPNTMLLVRHTLTNLHFRSDNIAELENSLAPILKGHSQPALGVSK